MSLIVHKAKIAQLEIQKDIIEQCKSGSTRAQYKLYNSYAKAMFNTCMRMLNNREAAEDVLQESFSEAFRRLDSYRYESTFGAWLKRIVVNRCINEIKRKKAELVFVEDISVFNRSESEEESTISFDVKSVKRAMEQLPNGSRMIFSLYMLEGYDHKEIADILGVSESNSKSQYSRAKSKIKEILKGGKYEK